MRILFMRILFTIVAFVVSWAVPAWAQQSAVTDLSTKGAVHTLNRADVNAWLDGLVPYALKAGEIAGAVVTVVANGEVLTLRGYGDADVAAGRAVDPQRTLFRMGSVSKLITWTAVMQQVERGILDLDTDLNAYIDFTIPPFEGQPITLRNIMTHTAGFEEQLKHVIAYDPEESVNFEDLVRRFVPARIFAPGSTPAYSNYGTALAGLIVERVAGQSFAEYVAENIFVPLGMESATFSQDLTAAQLSDLSKGYVTASTDPLPFELIAASPAGALTATAPDMGRFMLAHLDEGRLDNARILQPATARLMQRQVLTSIPALNGIALGFYESSINGHRVISHAGDTIVFHSDLNLFIEDGVGIFISINSTGENAAAYKLRALLFSEFADRYFPGKFTPRPVDIGQGNAHLLAGQWTSSRRTDTSFLSMSDLLSPTNIVATMDGRLQGTNLPIVGETVQEWVEVEPFVWQASNSHERLAAIVGDKGPIRFSIDSVAPIMVYERVPWQRSAAWLVPALLVSLSLLALTGAQWPVAALVRRRYGARLLLSGPALLAYHGVRASAVAMFFTLLGWFVLLITVFSDLSLLGNRTDLALMTLEVATIAGSTTLGATAAANAFFAVRDGRSIWSRIVAMALMLATLVVIWVAFVFNLLKLGVSY